MFITLGAVIIIGLIICAIITWMPYDIQNKLYIRSSPFDKLYGKDIHIKGIYEKRYTNFLARRDKAKQQKAEK